MAKRATNNNSDDLIDEGEQLSESYISIGLGLLVVIVVGILLFNYFNSKNQTEDAASDNAEQITQESTTSAKPGTTYTVVPGDTLWSISEKSFGTGDRWSEIAKANDLSNTDQLVSGQQLKIPESSPAASAIALASPIVSPSPVALASIEPSAAAVVTSPSPIAVSSPTVGGTTVTASPQPVTTGATISSNSYTIVAGDTLWDIACRAYGDCYAWSKIAQSNNLVNPNLIHAGNTLTLPR